MAGGALELIELKSLIAAQPASRYPQFENEWVRHFVNAGIPTKHLATTLVAFQPSGRCGHRAFDGIQSECGMFHEGWDELHELTGVSESTLKRLVKKLAEKGLACKKRRGADAGYKKGSIISLTIPGVGTFEDWKDISQPIAA